MKKVKISNKDLEALYEGILKLKNVKECKQFFRDLCTLSELTAMAERFVVAKMTTQNIPYRDICKKTGSSTATITRVAHWMHHGTGGYKIVLERLK